jgi:hypothetical protein
VDAAAESVAVVIAPWNAANAAFTSAVVAALAVDVVWAVNGAAVASANDAATTDTATPRLMILRTVPLRVRDQAS